MYLLDYTTQIQPSLKRLRDCARDSLIGNSSLDHTSPSREDGEAESFRAPSPSVATSSSPNTSSNKLSSAIVGADLFHDLVMGQIRGSELKGKASTQEQTLQEG